MTGGNAMDATEPNPTAGQGWLDDKQWQQLCRLSMLPAFEGITDHLTTAPNMWQLFCETGGRWSGNDGLPAPWNSKLDALQRILVLRCILPGKVRGVWHGAACCL